MRAFLRGQVFQSVDTHPHCVITLLFDESASTPVHSSHPRYIPVEAEHPTRPAFEEAGSHMHTDNVMAVVPKDRLQS